MKHNKLKVSKKLKLLILLTSNYDNLHHKKRLLNQKMYNGKLIKKKYANRTLVDCKVCHVTAFSSIATEKNVRKNFVLRKLTPEKPELGKEHFVIIVKKIGSFIGSNKKNIINYLEQHIMLHYP